MAFKLDRCASTKGCRLQSYLEIPFDCLVARFGEPRAGDGVSILNEWVFTDAAGNAYKIYDWKATTMFDRSLISPARFRELPVYNWHIGAYPGVPWEDFKLWLHNECNVKDPDVSSMRRDKLLALFTKYDPDRLGYLETSQMRACIRKIGTKFCRPVNEQFIEATLRDFCEVDSCGNGKILKIEFMNYFLIAYEDVSDEDFSAALDHFLHPTYDITDTALRAVFWKLDKDGSGFIPAQTLKDVAEKLASQCNVEFNNDDLSEAMGHFEYTDGTDGMVSEEQFQTIILEMFTKVDHRTFLRECGYFQLSVAPERSELLRAVYHKHNNGDTMQGEEFRYFLARFAKLNGTELDDQSLIDLSKQFAGIDINGDGVISEQEFVDHFLSEMMDVSDFDFHVTIKYFYAGTMTFY